MFDREVSPSAEVQCFIDQSSIADRSEQPETLTSDIELTSV